MKRKISITINEKTLKAIDAIIDNVYIRNRSQAIEYLSESSLGADKTAVILSGGAEEKIRISQDEYRITAKMGRVTVIEEAIRKLKENGFKTIYLIARHNVLTSVFNIMKDGSGYGVALHYVEEKDSLGTAESLKYLKGKVKSDFLVVYGDIIFSKVKIDDLWQDHLKQKGMATLLLTTSPAPEKKGVVEMEGNKILSFVQKPKKTDIYLGFSSIFACDAEIFNLEGKSLEYDVFPRLAGRGLLNGHLSTQRVIKVHSLKDIKNSFSER